MHCTTDKAVVGKYSRVQTGANLHKLPCWFLCLEMGCCGHDTGGRVAERWTFGLGESNQFQIMAAAFGCVEAQVADQPKMANSQK